MLATAMAMLSAKALMQIEPMPEVYSKYLINGSIAKAKIDQLIADAAKKVVVVATADKIGYQAFARICRPAQIDMIITDEEPDPAVRKRFEEQGVEVVVC